MSLNIGAWYLCVIRYLTSEADFLVIFMKWSYQAKYWRGNLRVEIKFILFIKLHRDILWHYKDLTKINSPAL